MTLALLSRLSDHARQRGDEPAIRVVGPMAATHPPVSWDALHKQVIDAARWCGASLPASRTSGGGGVMVLGANQPALAAVYLGVLASGRTLFPVDATLTAVELEQLAQRSGIHHAIADTPHADKLERAGLRVFLMSSIFQEAGPETGFAVEGSDHAPDTLARSDHAWLMLQSSGTTGGPKLARRDGPSLDAVARNVAEAVGLRQSDRVLAAVPLSHSYGLENGLLAPLWAGCTMLHHAPGTSPGKFGRGFDPMLSVTCGATVLPGVPAMFEMILNMNAGRGKLRLAYSAGAPLPEHIAQQLERRDGLRIASLYGCTEVGSVTYGTVPGTVGEPMRGVSIRILDPETLDALPPGDEGHVAVHAPSMFAGYVEPEDNAGCLRDGHFLTGDLGRLDAAGNLHITGRLKLLIDVGGVKVNPLEVEQAIGLFPGVRECVVVPDAVSPTISRVKAIVVPEGDELDEPALRGFLRQRLAAHKVPRTFEVRSSLPRGATGKVLRQKLQVSA